MSLQVAEIMLAQLGGPRFIAMTGAKNFVGDAKSLTMTLPRFPGMKCNRVRVQLEADDTYTVCAMQYMPARLDVINLGSRHGVYAEDLRGVFKTLTGLECTL